MVQAPPLALPVADPGNYKGCSKGQIFSPLLYVFYSELVGKYLVLVVLESYNLEASFAGDHLQNSVRK